MKDYSNVYILAIFLIFNISSQSQGVDTTQLTLRQADSMLVTGNLSLIASKYMVDAAKAQILQAKLFQNPNVNIVLGILNPGAGGFFDAGPNGEIAFSVSQLFRIAGQSADQRVYHR